MFKKKNTGSARLEKVKQDDGKFLESSEESGRCICHRKPKTLICINCKMFTYGRIQQVCLEHVNVTFLMDFNYCPNCLGPKHLMRGVDVDQGFYNYINASASFKTTHNVSCEGNAAAAYDSLKL